MTTPILASDFWMGVGLLAVLTFLARFSFIGLMRGQPSEWLSRMLSFVPVTVLPALIVPIVLFPKATGGQMDPERIIAALLALIIGAQTKSTLLTILGGMGSFWLIRSLS